MPKRTYLIAVAGSERPLKLEWSFPWKNMRIATDGQVIGEIASSKELKQGKQFELSDGSSLSVRLRRMFMAVDLEVLHNGQPIRGSATDPHTLVRNAWVTVYVLAGLNLVAGVVGMAFQGAGNLGFGLYNLALVPLYVAAAYFIRRFSLLALSLAIGIFLGDAVMAMIAQIRMHMNLGPGWIIVRILILSILFRAVKPMDLLRKH